MEIQTCDTVLARFCIGYGFQSGWFLWLLYCSVFTRRAALDVLAVYFAWTHPYVFSEEGRVSL